MEFVAGALIGLVAGAAATLGLLRRNTSARVLEGRGLVLVIATVALVVAGIALADSNRGHGAAAPAPTTVPPAPTTTSAAPTTGASSTPVSSTATVTTPPTGAVTVPKVESLSRAEAVPILERAGLKVSIETLPLSNVPPDYVISQSPLPGATANAGTVVVLVVSAAA
jgi:beta-lactam-binding protein with PASTA domain